MLYKVTKQYLRGGDLPAGQFNDIAQAKNFIATQLKEDERMRVKIIYRLFEGMELIQEFSKAENTSNGDDTSGSNSGRKQTTTFKPTPLSTSLRPTGMPSNWHNEEQET